MIIKTFGWYRPVYTLRMTFKDHRYNSNDDIIIQEDFNYTSLLEANKKLEKFAGGYCETCGNKRFNRCKYKIDE